MNNLTLYQIEKEYIDLADQLINGELTIEIESTLKVNKDNLQNKAVNYGFVCKQLDSENNIIQTEIDRLVNLKDKRKSVIDKLKKSLSDAMQLYQIEKIETPLIKISFRKSETAEIDNIDLIPSQFVVTKENKIADKKAIKEAIVNGIVVLGARIQTNKYIQIK